jgi:hypothetical protein
MYDPLVELHVRCEAAYMVRHRVFVGRRRAPMSDGVRFWRRRSVGEEHSPARGLVRQGFRRWRGMFRWYLHNAVCVFRLYRICAGVCKRELSYLPY